MIRVLVNGCHGAMGQSVIEEISKRQDILVACGVDRTPEKRELAFNVYSRIQEIKEEIDLIIDFSHPFYLSDTLAYCTRHKVPIVMGTTGYTDEEKQKIELAAGYAPILYAANTSIGVNLMEVLVRKVALAFKDEVDIEIIERHHRTKKDAPSGTARMFVRAINESLNVSKKMQCGREGKAIERTEAEIGVHSIRGGQLDSDHTVLFASQDETLEIHSNVRNLASFSKGAIYAGLQLVSYKPGLYKMSDLIQF